MPYNIADLIEATADTVPERGALVAGDQRRNFFAGYKLPRELHLLPGMPRPPTETPDHPDARTCNPRHAQASTSHLRRRRNAYPDL